MKIAKLQEKKKKLHQRNVKKNFIPGEKWTLQIPAPSLWIRWKSIFFFAQLLANKRFIHFSFRYSKVHHHGLAHANPAMVNKDKIPRFLCCKQATKNFSPPPPFFFLSLQLPLLPDDEQLVKRT